MLSLCAQLESGSVRVNGSRTSDPVDTAAVGLLGGKRTIDLGRDRGRLSPAPHDQTHHLRDIDQE